MKTTALAALALAATWSAAFAVTDAEIAPAALPGKTLVFTIVNGGAPYATTGTWSGAFAASGNGFEVANIDGDTAGISTTFAATTDGTYTNVALPEFVEGQPAATLTLYTQDGVGRYEVAIAGVFGVSLNGTFTIAPPITARKPGEISIRQPKGHSLRDGKSKLGFGHVLAGESGKTETFIVKNAGAGPLEILGITLTGGGKGDFKISKLKKDSLDAGSSLRFKVTFKPHSIGKRKAKLHILSSDSNEGSFDIVLKGRAVGIR